MINGNTLNKMETKRLKWSSMEVNGNKFEFDEVQRKYNELEEL